MTHFTTTKSQSLARALVAGVGALLLACTPAKQDDDSADEGDTTGAPADPCPDYCEVEQTCHSDPGWTYEECVELCGQELEALASVPSCQAGFVGLLGCMGSLSCEEYNQWLTGFDPPYPCSDEEFAFAESCEEPPGCDVAGGGTQDGSICNYHYACSGAATYQVECSEAGVCTCLVDGDMVGGCDELYPQICEPLGGELGTEEVIVERMNSCCGWTLEL